MPERRNRIRTRLVVTFIALVTILVVASAMVWYRVATSHLRRETENRLVAIAEAGGLVFDENLITFLVSGFSRRVHDIVQGQLLQIKDRLGVREAYIFDRDHRILATTDTIGMDLGQVAAGLENYEAEIERAFAGEAVVTVPFRDDEGNVYQTALAPLMGYRDPEGRQPAVVAVFGVDLSVGFLEVFNDFRQMTIVLSAIGVLLTILVGVFFAGTLSRPLDKLVKSAERMERGEMGEPVAIEARDEIGYLGNALENMRKGIMRRDRHLRTMLAGVAHEIRNPLGGIEIFAGLLRDELANADPRRSHLDKIIREVKHLKTIINEFLIYARPRQPMVEPFLLREVLDDMAFLLSGDAETRGVELEVEVSSPDLAVYADVEQIKRALLNLVKNALQASPAGGCVQVRAQGVHDRVRIQVQDSGPGIHADHIKQVFDPFFTTKGSGAGLGLSIVRSIIEENDGEIWVESVPGEKTTFFIVLPTVESGPSRFRAMDSPSAERVGAVLGSG
ncbi:MAG TPA: HAMP domain-containing sensor histidine kinase [Gemmatimonadota bacterium]|nr:HAMP domain-containing sensor histidine kinase [Gemmatimonadota bacterium]